jgi:hypothetical protein
MAIDPSILDVSKRQILTPPKALLDSFVDTLETLLLGLLFLFTG